MPKYLLRRRNRFGQYSHLDTYDYEPPEWQIKRRFGPGAYSILIAEDGVRGLRKVRDITIPWNINYVGWMNGSPSIDDIRNKYGPGSYFILQSCQVRGWHVTAQPIAYSRTTYEFLQDGAQAMKNISIIFRVDMPWVE